MRAILSSLCLLAWLGLETALGASGQTNRPAPPAPVPPAVAASPVAEFRRLLQMSAAQREAELAAMPPAKQKLAAALRVKLREYANLPPAECEARLRVLDLRWYLLPAMQTDPAQRPARLAAMPADLRPFVEERLEQWDALPRAQQKELLENEPILRQLLGLAAAPPNERAATLAQWGTDQRQFLQESLQRWQLLSGEQRQRMTEQFQRFFNLSAPERAKTLHAFSETDRRQMESTLRAFEKLAPEKRRACLEAFGRFATLSEEDRNEFLQNASRWQAMTPAERQTWRSLVLRVPPLPPSFARVPPAPPLPPPPKNPPEPVLTLTNLSR